ncbi:MAG TPA: hypothetical protein VGJ72_09990 [Polaromonas sp.]|jgi:hypothetical protein
MSKLAWVALVAVVLISAGCSSMGMGGSTTTSSTSYGDMSHWAHDSLYSGRE